MRAAGGLTAYRELLDRLVPARRFGVVLGLERMRALLDRLGAPDRRMGTIVHVGGTNGKGSTVAMIAALVSASVRVATYTSPHLSSLRERIGIAGAPISEQAIVAAADEVRAAGGDELTFFEQVTAIACVAIAAAGVAVTVLEVGLGGRLDATTAIAAPIAVVTGVALDHEAILGSTLAAIAAEKAGIFKAGQHIVVGASGEPAAVAQLVTAAEGCGAASVTVIDAAAIARVPPVGLAGAHQRANAAAALAAVAHLDALGALGPPGTPGTDADARARALAAVTHPGRFEMFALPASGEPGGHVDAERPPPAPGPLVILDGAHNPHGAAALAAALHARGLQPTCILAVSADKDAGAMVRALASVASSFIATRYQQDRALPPEALAAVITAVIAGPGSGPGTGAVEIAATLADAIATARTRSQPILIAGSLFLVGEARTLLLGAPTDPILVTDPPARAP